MSCVGGQKCVAGRVVSDTDTNNNIGYEPKVNIYIHYTTVIALCTKRIISYVLYYYLTAYYHLYINHHNTIHHTDTTLTHTV